MPDHYLKEIFEKICLTLEDSGFDIEDIINPFPDFEEIDDIGLFEGLCKAIFSAQAKWETYEKNFWRIDPLLFHYDFRRIVNLSDDEINGICEQMIEMEVRDRFIRRKIHDFRKNASVFIGLLEKNVSVHSFLKRELSDKEGLIEKLIRKGSPYKLSGVGLPVCCEFLKNVGVDDFKPDVHMIYLFNRIGIVKTKNPKIATYKELHSVRKMGMEIATSANKPFHAVDNILLFFCAEGKGEICTTRTPKCRRCKLLNENICKGFPKFGESTQASLFR